LASLLFAAAFLTILARVQTLQRSVFDIIGGVSEEANNQAACVIAGLDMDDIILSLWSSTAYRCASTVRWPWRPTCHRWP
jgi:hypothetical protein